jgi:hypothetical protein
MEKIGICSMCIDKRYDLLTSSYLNTNIGDYYLIATAGSALCVGYNDFCKKVCNCPCNRNVNSNNSNKSCDPANPDMEILKASFIKNIDISLSLDELKEIYLLNHQDCGAIKAYLECSGYPQNLGENNSMEIKIHTDLLLYAEEYLRTKYPDIRVRLGLIDINGTVCDYDQTFSSWKLIYRGAGFNPKALWYGL